MVNKQLEAEGYTPVGQLYMLMVGEPLLSATLIVLWLAGLIATALLLRAKRWAWGWGVLAYVICAPVSLIYAAAVPVRES